MVVRRLPDSELYHYGILGQKWGRRRYQNEDGSLTPAGKLRYGTVERYNEHLADSVKRKQRRQALQNRRMLSDDDIDRIIKRLQKEKTLKQLTESDLSPGKKYADDFLQKVGGTVLTSVVTGAIMYGLNYAITGKGGKEKAAEFIAPPKKKK